MYFYIYNGPVYQFGKIINSKWNAQTMAVSDAKAYSNLVYQYKNRHDLLSTSRIQLDKKKLTKMEESPI